MYTKGRWINGIQLLRARQHWMYIVTNSEFGYTIVDHKFMISGQSYLLNDRDFGSIEKANLKTEYVLVSEDWYTKYRKQEERIPLKL